MGLGNFSKVIYLVRKWEAGFETQCNLSLKHELSPRDILSQMRESICLIDNSGKFKDKVLCYTRIWSSWQFWGHC